MTMKPPPHSGHPPWGRQLHKPVAPTGTPSPWRDLELQLTPKGKRFRVGEYISGLFTLPAALNKEAYRVQLNYTQHIVSRESERVQVLSAVGYGGRELGRGPSYPFRFNRPIAGVNYQSDEVCIDYYVELLVYQTDAAALPIATRRAEVSVMHSGITYAVEPTVLPLVGADVTTPVGAAAGAVFMAVVISLFSLWSALGFALLVGVPLLARGIHYLLQWYHFRRASFRIGPSWELRDLHFEPTGRVDLLDGALSLTVTERYARTNTDGIAVVRKRQVYQQTTHLLDVIALPIKPSATAFHVPLPAPDRLLPTSTTTTGITCLWELMYTHRLPYWPVPLRRRWALRVGMKGKKRP